MKKFFIILFVVLCFALVSCKPKEDKKKEEDKIQVSLNKESLKDSYYIDEFELGSIQLSVEKNGNKESISITKDMIAECPDFTIPGNYNFRVTYEGKSISISFLLKEKEVYTEGLTFTLNGAGNGYIVNLYSGTSKEVIIPGIYNDLPVVEIKNNAFKNNQVIEKVVLGKNINKIGDTAFQNSSIKEIVLDDSLITIGNACFYQCTNMKEMIVPNSVSSVGEKAFDNVVILYLEDGIKTSSWHNNYKGNNTFIYENVNLNNLKNNDLFRYLVDDNGITITNYLRDDLEKVELPNKIDDKEIVKLGAYSFSEHLEITSITLVDSIKVIGPHALASLSITSLVLPKNLETIETYGIATCRVMLSITFNEGLKTIAQAAFSSSEVLEIVDLPSTLESLGGYAFQNCYKIQKVYIKLNCKTIGAGCFYSNSKSTIYYEGASMPEGWDPSFNPNNRTIVYNYVG